MDYRPDICIFHGNCDDGFGAAWAIRSRWPDCEFVPGHYGKPLPNTARKHVLFVDFSAKRAEIDAMAQEAISIVILDHHKTAEAELAPFNVTMCGTAILDPANLWHMFCDLDELGRPPIVAWFDMNQSGAALAWQFANGAHRDRDPLPRMIQYIEDRDLWRFAFGSSTHEFSAALRTYPMDFAVWDDIAADTGALLAEGRTVLRAHNVNVYKLVAQAYQDQVCGFIVPVVNAPYHYASDVAHALLLAYPDAPFAGSWFRRPDGFVQWSLRSEDRREDVSEIAKRMGGGGHRNAAGFQASWVL